MSTFSHIGTPTPLLDGRERVTAAIRYTGDLSLSGMLHARFVTSTYAHANNVIAFFERK